MYARMYCMYIRTPTILYDTNTRTHIHTYIHTHIYTYTYIYIHTHIYTYTHIYTHTYIYIYIYIFIINIYIVNTDHTTKMDIDTTTQTLPDFVNFVCES